MLTAQNKYKEDIFRRNGHRKKSDKIQFLFINKNSKNLE